MPSESAHYETAGHLPEKVETERFQYENVQGVQLAEFSLVTIASYYIKLQILQITNLIRVSGLVKIYICSIFS